MRCELCGEYTDTIYEVVIEGSKMRVCERCASGLKVVGKISEGRDETSKGAKMQDEKGMLDFFLRDDYLKTILDSVKENNLTVDSLSSITGVEKVEIEKVLKGKMLPSEDLARRLERALKIKLFDRESSQR